MRELTIYEMNRINTVLMNTLKVGQSYLPQEVETTLKFEGITKKDYGFGSVEEFIRNLPCFTVESTGNSFLNAMFNGKQTVGPILRKKPIELPIVAKTKSVTISPVEITERKTMTCSASTGCEMKNMDNENHGKKKTWGFKEEKPMEVFYDSVKLFPNKTVFLEKLAKEVADEPWNFPGGKSKYHILENYLKVVFYKLRKEGKIVYSKDYQRAAFNTGLVNDRFQDIYICLERSKPGYTREYVTTGITTDGDSLRFLDKKPERALFIKDYKDLYYDTDLYLDVSWNHIVIDHVERFPLDFLRRKLGESIDVSKILDEIAVEDKPSVINALFNRLRRFLKENPFYYQEIVASVQNAIEVAKSRIKNDYKIPIAGYYPRLDTISLNIPLCLSSSRETSLILVVERKGSRYIGHTVYTPIMAYSSARVISKQENSWLTAFMG